MKTGDLLLVIVFLLKISGKVAQERIDDDEIVNVHFQTTGAPDITSALKYRGRIPEIPAYTVCIRIRMHRHRLWASILSYGKEDDVIGYKDQLVLGLTKISNEIWSFGNQLQGLVDEDVELHRWRHTCYLVDLQTLKWRVFLNDQYWEGRFQTKLKRGLLPSDGFLVLGQEQDEGEDDGYSKRQSFNGELNDLFFSDYLITDEEVQKFLRCEPLYGERLVDFRTLNETFDILGNTMVEVVSRKSLCKYNKNDDYDDIVFPEGRPYAVTHLHCKKFRAELTLPMNDEENEVVFQKLQPYSKECFHASGSIVWINAYFFEDAGMWLHATTRQELDYMKFATGYESGSNSRNCPAIFHVHPFGSLWGHHTCEQKFCGMCRLEMLLKYRVRGLCASSKIDDTFHASGYRNKKIQFMGFYTSTIYWNNKTWALASMDDTVDLYGEMAMANVNDYPLGYHTWTIRGDTCGKRGVENEVVLIMTTCPEGGFTCNSGHCIESIQRCDQQPDCPDESDEQECSLINFPEGYNRDLQPPQTSEGKAIVIHVHITIKGIRRVDLIRESFYINIGENLEWFDDRLQFMNLKNESFLNVIPKATEDLIWLPDVQKEDDSEQEADVTLRGRSIKVVRSSEPIEDNAALAKEDKYFDGALNRLAMTVENSVIFSCRYDFVDYPFDLQTCIMVFKLGSVTSSYAELRLKDEGVLYNGSRRLMEYEVMEISARNTSVGMYSSVQVTIVFKNLYQYYISSTFIPTTLLIIIALLTFRYRLDDFQNRIMVSLTALLVLASLFTQVSSSIPKTSYVKLIDLWFLLAIVYVFLTILFLVLIEYRRNKPETEGSVTKVMPLSEPKSDRYLGIVTDDSIRLNEKCKKFLTITWGFLLFVYILLASVGVRVFG